MSHNSFTELTVYQKCRELRLEISSSMRLALPSDEKFRLLDQIIRSSRSVSANIAEGHGRYYFKENVRFCRMAKGSLGETREHLITAFDEGFITADTFNSLHSQYEDCRRLLNDYIAYLRKAKPGLEPNS